MPKKLPKKRALKRIIKILVFFGLAAIVIAIAPLLPFPKPQKSFCANSISCISNLTGEFEENATTGVFLEKEFTVPAAISQKQSNDYAVLGDESVSKQIYVDLTTQHLYAFEDNKMVYDFPVSTGKWGATPTGSFNIWVKLRYTRMSGGDPKRGTYYNLPNVPYTMFFYNKDIAKSMGYSIHGAYWHDNFGHPMSHGCVNMKTEDVEKIYNWANPPATSSITYATETDPGTPIIIYGQPPNE